MAKSVTQIAQQVLDRARTYENYFAEKGLPVPSFDTDSFPEPDLPPEIRATRDAILDASTELQDLVRGPSEIVRNTATYHPHFFALQAISRYNIVAHIPEQGTISYSDLGKLCGLRGGDVKRLIRYAMTCHIFAEPTKEHVGHNGASKALAENHILRQWFGMVTEELWPAATRAVDAMHKWPGSEESTQAGFQLAHNTTNAIFAEVTSDPQRAKRFAEAMSLFSTAPGFEVSHIVDTYPWANINDGKAFTFVDLGGSFGTVDIAVLRSFPQAHCIVQDLPRMISKAQTPDDLKERLTFTEHDFFTPQTVQADVYFFRWIFHDWADSYCIKILRSLISALKPGARIIVNEFCLPLPDQVSAYHGRIMRSFDLTMLSLQNSKERDVDDWKQVFGDADPRFQLRNIYVPQGSPMALIEFVWAA